MDNIILPGGTQGTIPPELLRGAVQGVVPVIPKKIRDAQAAYIEEGQLILRDLEDIVNADASEVDPTLAIIANSLKWIMKGQLPITDLDENKV